MAILGDLEAQIMEILWHHTEPMSVRQVHEELLDRRELAYTTVMTVLDRLAKKGIARRERDGRAWLYLAARTRAELYAAGVLDILRDSGADQPEVMQRVLAGIDAGQREGLVAALRAQA